MSSVRFGKYSGKVKIDFSSQHKTSILVDGKTQHRKPVEHGAESLTSPGTPKRRFCCVPFSSDSTQRLVYPMLHMWSRPSQKPVEIKTHNTRLVSRPCVVVDTEVGVGKDLGKYSEIGNYLFYRGFMNVRIKVSFVDLTKYQTYCRSILCPIPSS